MKALVCSVLFALTCTEPAVPPVQFASVQVAQLSSVQPILQEDTDQLTGFTDLMHRTSNWIRAETRELDLPALAGIYSNADTPIVAQFIDLATSQLDIEIYEMEDILVRKAIDRAMERGVRVRVLQEPQVIGDTCDAFGDGLKGASASRASADVISDCKLQQALVKRVRAHGGRYEPFNKAELCGQTEAAGRCYQHGKMIIVDRKYALISTGNFNTSNLCNLKDPLGPPRSCNRDYTYVTVDTDAVQALQEIFDKDLEGKRYDLKAILDRPGVKGKITVSPYSFEPIEALLSSATRYIRFQNQYIRPNSGLADVLIKKASEGIPVEVLLADVCHYGRVSDKQAYDYNLMFFAMEEAGVRIRMMSKTRKIQNKPAYLHAKGIVVDDIAWTGSVNGSLGSLQQNREFGIFWAHPQRVNAFLRMMDEDFEHASSQTWRDSLACRNVGYTDPKATVRETPDYDKRMDDISTRLQRSPRVRVDEEELVD